MTSYNSNTPKAILDGKLDFALYELSMNGLFADTVPDVDIDKRFQLVQPHPLSSIFVCPIVPSKQPTIEEIWDINDFLSFRNDIPSIPIPESTSFRNFEYEYLYGRAKHQKQLTLHNFDDGTKTTQIVNPHKKYELENSTFIESQLNILSEVVSIKFGPLAGVLFYLQEQNKTTIDSTKEFKPACKEIRFYAMAVRQSDFLSELLCYYRIFESILPNDHYGLLNQCMDRIPTYNFGKVKIRNQAEDYQVAPQNLFTLMRRRATKQIKKLSSRGIQNIGEYLYKNERCEIAHGKVSTRVSYLGRDYFESYNNMLILKLAARIAIEDKLKKLS